MAVQPVLLRDDRSDRRGNAAVARVSLVGEALRKATYEVCDACSGDGCKGCYGGLVPHGHTTQKRKFSTEDRVRLAREGKAIPVRRAGEIVGGRYPIETASDLRNAISAFGRGRDGGEVKRHIVKRARALGMTDVLPSEWVNKVETFSKPGTADVTPDDLRRLRPLLEHYRKKPHPFAACKRDQMKHGLSEGHANRRCAVIKDLIEGHTRWRGKSRDVTMSYEWSDEVMEALDRLDPDGEGLEPRRSTGIVADAIDRRR